MLNNLSIEPMKGYGDLPFGMSIDDAIKKLGDPSLQEELEPLDEDGNRTVVLEYEESKLSIYFEGVTKTVIESFSTENPESILFGEKIFGMDKKGIVDFMKKKGYKEYEEDEEEGELCLSYEDLMLDFYFDDDQLIDVLWGVIIDNQGNIVEV